MDRFGQIGTNLGRARAKQWSTQNPTRGTCGLRSEIVISRGGPTLFNTDSLSAATQLPNNNTSRSRGSGANKYPKSACQISLRRTISCFSLFGLGLTMTVRDVEALLGRAIPELYDDRKGRCTPTSPSDSAHAAFESMAMGWSWALHFCNESIAEDRPHRRGVATRALGRLPAAAAVRRARPGDGAVR